jgi:hypothetical protein
LLIKYSDGISFIGTVKRARDLASVLGSASNRIDTNSYPTTQSSKLYYGLFFEKYIEYWRRQMLISSISCDDMNKLLSCSAIRHIRLPDSDEKVGFVEKGFLIYLNNSLGPTLNYS